MPKAILELEMPGGCETCPIKRYFHYGWVEYICGITGEEIANKGRRSDCPLNPVDTDMLEKQKPKKVIETPDKHKYGYCPVCGRIYWDKCHIGNYCDQCGQRLEVEP
jgi:hypothetical protein